MYDIVKVSKKNKKKYKKIYIQYKYIGMRVCM